jgi:hypothetical protein
MNRRLSTKEQKRLADDARLLRAWRKFHREERDVALATHGALLGELFRMIDNLECVRPAQLLGLVRSIDWTLIDYPTRLVTVHELNSSITAYREKRGLEPIDDGVPGEPETPFRTIKAIVLTASPLCEGARRGGARSE